MYHNNFIEIKTIIIITGQGGIKAANLATIQGAS